MKLLSNSNGSETQIDGAAHADPNSISVEISSTVQEAIECIDRSRHLSIALVVDKDKRLINTISDGDIRRGIMGGFRLESPLSRVLEIKARTPHPRPLSARYGTTKAVLVSLMQGRGVRQIPLTDKDNRVVEVVALRDLLPDQVPGLQAMVMAGGFGVRLRPLTNAVPKPMLPIDGKPLIELIVKQLKSAGIRDICIATFFKSELIIEHFGDGREFGVNISYTRESSPLGTGGALGLMKRPEEPILVVNGDIMTGVDFAAMHAFHVEHKAKMTVAVRRYEVKVPYGIVYSSGVRLRRIREKPAIGCFVNAGIYLLDPKVFDLIVTGAHLEMTDLIGRLLRAKELVVTFPVLEAWLDIGQRADYERAQVAFGLKEAGNTAPR